jgi:hypothetical protein
VSAYWSRRNRSVRLAKDEDGIFCLKISYEVGTRDPGRVFRSMANLVASFTALDRVLEQSVGEKGMPTLLLEDIETGSLKTWLRNSLEAIDDDAIAELSWKKVVGSFLVKGKRRVVRILSDNPRLESRDDIARIQAAVAEVAEETGVTRLPIYTPPDPERLLRAASEISSAVAELSDDDSATYISEEGEIAISRRFAVTRDQIESLLTREIVSSTVEMILKVKKPDYLGMSMWELRHGEHPVAAKIEDMKWLRRFQAREIDVRPGDSLRALVRTDVRYGYQSEIVAVHHTILIVFETVRLPNDSQLLLQPPSSEASGDP